MLKINSITGSYIMKNQNVYAPTVKNKSKSFVSIMHNYQY